jgi:hypothetical protein
MKIYKVIIDTDGETTKRDGEVSTEIVQTKMYFAAQSIGVVFDAAMRRAGDGDGDVVAVIEVIPSVTILD